MRVEKVTVSRTKKVNLGNYESAEILVSMTADVDSAENPVEVGGKLAAISSQLIQEHGPKDMEQRARDKSPRPKATETPAPGKPNRMEAPMVGPDEAVPGPLSENVEARISGSPTLLNDGDRTYLKGLGFAFRPNESSWTAILPRKMVKTVHAWVLDHRMDVEFAPTVPA